MNLLSFFKRKPSLSVVFNIRDTEISTSAIKLSKNTKPEIMLCKSLNFNKSGELNSQKYVEVLLKSIEEADAVIRKGLIKIGNTLEIKNYYFFIGTPWSATQSRLIKITKDRPFVIDNDFLNQIIKSKEQETEKQIEEENNKEDWTLLEEKIIQSKLNGYKIENIYDKTAKDLELHFFLSFLPKSLKNKIGVYCQKRLNENQSNIFHSNNLSSFIFLRDLFSDKNDFVYADIGQEITDIYIIKDDVLEATASFPYGEKNIFKNIFNKSSLSLEILNSAISIKEHGNLEENEQKKIEGVIYIELQTWADKLQSILSKITSGKNCPKDMFLISNTSLSNILIEEIKKNRKDNPVKFFGVKPKITIIKEGKINSLIKGARAFSGFPYVKIDIVFLDKLLKNII